ncbi:NAD(P)/FAD-dependent oxidoreductase [Brevifollis gellanilyticus]|uniref:FAD-dependent oxidoreductase n=1 Tax=Brevifollis gellanilyticus TaxID=748831 RepID=A0A512M3X7_9BACT|nr:FAD-dependent oxidoreductase [Brevifollis gellanilyticus]GEP41432.1 FAD-dependent oxidoreductase [Brevifollis gellanilyticus]
MTAPRILIIGGGLAGTCLAWRLHERGVPFMIVDRDEPGTSSKIAAGLVTPITGMRMNLSWRYDTLHPEAVVFYRHLESVLGSSFYHDLPIVKLLRDQWSADRWQKRREQPDFKPYFKDTQNPLVDENIFSAPFGGFEMQHSGWLDSATFLAASRAYFIERGCWQTGESDGSLVWRGETFTHAVFCIGWEAARHAWFDWVPFGSARGTVLQVKADTGGETRIINRGCWLLPRADGTLRAGPTYELSFDDASTPSPAAIEDLETKLQSLLKQPYEILDSQTAVRPIIPRKHALIGFHPGKPNIGFINGLGSKGVLRAPWVGRQFVEHLLDAKPIEPDMDLAGNF